MCLLVLAWRTHPRCSLVIAANRDEYHDRPAAPLAPWTDPAGMLAGRDLRAGGTWLGLDARRRFGVITNFRDPPGEASPAVPPTVSGGGAPGPDILSGRPPPGSARALRSRGDLIPGYFGRGGGAGEYLESVADEAGSYGGFNLLLADGESLWYASNRGTPFAQRLPPGIYGLANERLDTPWPKLRRVREGFERWLPSGSPEDGGLFALLDDRRPAGAGGTLPPAGPAAAWDRALAAPFVLNERYGTRCSTVVAIEPTGRCYLAERRFDPSGTRSGETEFRLGADEWPPAPPRR